MKYLDITYNKMNKVLFILSSLALLACTFDDEVDPNRPSLQGVLSEASINQLNNLVVGVQSTMRSGLEIQTTGSGTMARELYLFDADPETLLIFWWLMVLIWIIIPSIPHLLGEIAMLQ